jgi:hypothetical protein
MINVIPAVKAASNYLLSVKDIMGNLQNIRLEEVELSEDRKYWLITWGFDIPLKNKNPLRIAGLLQEGNLLTREYKLFKVNSETNEVESMKIRKL